MSPLASSIVTTTVGLLAGLAVSGLALYRQRRVIAGLRHDATHDELTGLPNRRAVILWLTLALLDEQPIGVILLDLDHFKTINDTAGHHAGNQVLIEVGLRLLGLGHPGTLAARMSGDEFVILAQHDPPRVAALADAAHTAIAAEPFHVGEHRFAVTASVGYALRPPATTLTELLAAADAAMYQAKTTGLGVHGQPATSATLSDPPPG